MVSYEFTAYPISQKVYGERAVYAYAHRDGAEWVIHYIGGADSLSHRVAKDPRREPAKWAGATHVLVHVPRDSDEVQYNEAVFRLAHAYKPPMNQNYRTRFGVGA
jgi:hypothetical protein